MGKVYGPRHGSMQFWPRVRSKSIHTRIRSWPNISEVKLLGFIGYKAGMTSVRYIDTKKTSPTKNELLSVPCTIIECPPIKIFSLRLYKQNKVVGEAINPKLDKEVGRRVTLPKNIKTKIPDSVTNFDEVRVVVYTQPKLTGIGKKTPELLELKISGKDAKIQLDYAKSNLDKEINVQSILKAGQLIDAHSITKGHGYQGPVKRFGIKLKSHKSEKGRRRPGTFGVWSGQQHVMYRVAFASKMGYHARTDYNKYVLKISEKADLSPIANYGVVRNSYILVKGSVPGPKNRMITMLHSIRVNNRTEMSLPTLK